MYIHSVLGCTIGGDNTSMVAQNKAVEIDIFVDLFINYHNKIMFNSKKKNNI